jgi:hypothetical protein
MAEFFIQKTPTLFIIHYTLYISKGGVFGHSFFN